MHELAYDRIAQIKGFLSSVVGPLCRDEKAEILAVIAFYCEDELNMHDYFRNANGRFVDVDSRDSGKKARES